MKAVFHKSKESISKQVLAETNCMGNKNGKVGLVIIKVQDCDLTGEDDVVCNEGINEQS